MCVCVYTHTYARIYIHAGEAARRARMRWQHTSNTLATHLHMYARR
jgi:hypothetical protein